MTSVDLGMFGLDCFVSDKTSSSLELDSDLCIQEFESLLQDNNSQNILDISLEQSGITENNNMSNMDTLEVSQGETAQTFLVNYDTTEFLRSHVTTPGQGVCVICTKWFFMNLDSHFQLPFPCFSCFQLP